MNNPYIYSDTAIGGVNRRNAPKVFMDVYCASLRKEPPEESYLGLFAFDETLVSYVRQHKTIRQFTGTHWSPFFALDIDREDLEEARSIATKIVETLEHDYEVDPELLHIFFSGNKGFHILIPSRYFKPSPNRMLARIFRMFCLRLFDESLVDLKIYEPLRLFRLPNSRHGTSKLYKVPITFKDLFGSIEDILSLAVNPNLTFQYPAAGQAVEKLVNIYKEAEEDLNNLSIKKSISVPSHKIYKNKDQVKACYLRLLEGVESGRRNETAVRLASHFRKQGLPLSATQAILIDWDDRNNPSFAEQGKTGELLRTVESAYDNEEIDYGCNDPILKSVCGNDCFMFQKRLAQNNDSQSLHTVYDAASAYVKRSRDDKGIMFNIPDLDKATRGVMPGHVVQYLACQGGGKTAFAIYLMRQVALQGKHSLFLSLEMPVEEVFERQCQMVGDITAEKIESIVDDMIAEGISDQEIVNKLFSSFHLETFNKVITSDRSSITVDEIGEIADLAKEKWPIECLFIDYLGRIDGIGPAYERVSKIVRDIKSLAKDLYLPVIYLNQTNRNIKSVTEMPSASDSRDSGQSEEAADIIIASSRPYYGEVNRSPDDQNSFSIRLLKNRRGVDKMVGDIELIFYPARMQFKTRSVLRTETYQGF